MSDPREDRDFHLRRHGEGPWAVAVILIAVGVIFLLRNFGFPLPHNWWALLLFIPAAGSLAAAWRLYERDGRMSGPASGSLFAALILIGLAFIFLLDVRVDWDLLWPVILILLGVAMLSRSYWRR